MKKNILILLLTCCVAVLAVQDYSATHGDLNHDGQVNVVDLSKLLKNYSH